MKVITIVAEAGISGFESPAAEYKELGLSLDQLIIKNPNATFIGQASGQSIWKETRLPVGVGFGETATLSKAANHAVQLSKQNPKNIRKQFSVVTERTVNELNGKCDENC